MDSSTEENKKSNIDDDSTDSGGVLPGDYVYNVFDIFPSSKTLNKKISKSTPKDQYDVFTTEDVKNVDNFLDVVNADKLARLGPENSDLNGLQSTMGILAELNRLEREKKIYSPAFYSCLHLCNEFRKKINRSSRCNVNCNFVKSY
ncbi:hypothetical protein HELRODRAFT_167165 [Helobdella robusta]|uniref:Uncharacterized protein n=1 Tax=Helobdella robusta TaxID=6412 RepID=T1EZ32_HELRO|nr:hypothetical protein HELRODRAFT_167165 [Helobdella robusta]ESO10658.1 hypothetical protein HELRODRAFT_167165 [Helobdella robusta]